MSTAAQASRFATVTPPAWAVPAGACDTHVHVFAPQRFAYALPRSYTPAEAGVDDLCALLASLRCQRVVLVQPSAYGADNRCLLDALAQLGPQRARGIAVADLESAASTDFAALQATGVRGLRLNLAVRGERDPQVARAALRRAGAALAGSDLSVQLYAGLPLLAALADDLLALDRPVVLDHFAGITGLDGAMPLAGPTAIPGFDALARLLQSGRVHVKLSAPYRVSRLGAAGPGLQALARHLVALAPRQMLWGSDWPHTGGSAGQRNGDLNRIEPFRPEDAGHTLDQLADWVPDAAMRHQILVDNPAALYGFEA